MSITDELREWKGNINTRLQPETVLALRRELNGIADRIDAEHEKAVTAAHSDCITKYGSMVAREYVKLPVDADGVPIRVGDVMDKGKVTCIRDCGNGWEVILNSLYTYDAPSLRHRAPTVEDVLREFADRVCSSGHQWGLDAADTIAEYAAKLQLREDE